MHVHLIAECHTHNMGGLSRYEKTLIEALQKKTVCTVAHISEIKKLSRLKQLFFLLSKNIYDKARTNEIDTMTHFLNQQLGLSLNFVPFKNIIVTIHDLAFIVPEYYKELSYVEQLRYKLVMKGLHRADWIITDAEFTKQEIINYLHFPAENIFVVPLGVDLTIFQQKKLSLQERQKYRHNSKGPVILYVGSEISRMNLYTLLEAIALLKKQIPFIQLLKIGEAKSKKGRQETLKHIKKLHIEDSVIFLEFVSEEELVKYYNTADVFVYPIEYTGYGLPILESLACGCPVITTNKTTIPEVIGDAGLLFDPHDTQQLKESILKVLQNKTFRKQMQKKGLRRVKKYSWEQCATNTIQVYEQILNELKEINRKSKC